MEQNIALPARPVSWKDLALFLLCGFGSLMLTNLLSSLVLQEITIWLTLTAALLNAACLGGTVYLLGIRRGHVSWACMGLLPEDWRGLWFFLGSAIAISLMPLRAVMAFVIQLMIEGNMDSVLLRGNLFMGGEGFSWLNFLISLTTIGLLVPFSEELFFRGLIYGGLQQKTGFWTRVLLSAAIFGLAHFDSAGVAISGFVLGIANALAYEKSRTLWLPIMIHASTNSIAVIILYASLLIPVA